MEFFRIKTFEITEVNVENDEWVKIEKWVPTYFYPNKKPLLPRTIGYMDQTQINALPTKEDIIKMLKEQGKIHSL